MAKAMFKRSLLHPKWWLSWLTFGLWWFVVQVLPFSIQMRLGNALGKFLGRVIKRRRIVAEKNIAMCLANLGEEQREAIYTASMASAGRAIFESGMAWFWPRWRLKNKFRIEGIEHLDRAKIDGRGVLFLGVHFTTIEICAAFLNIESSIDGFYRPHKNAVYEFIQRRGRERHNAYSRAIPREDVRAIIKALRKGRVINYAADQDYGRAHSVFVPFFDIPAATVTAPSQLVKLGKASIVPYSTGWNDADKIYEIKIFPAFSEFGEGDTESDARQINQFVESQVRKNPGQYLWSHRRFKTRPDGRKDFYEISHLLNPNRRK